MFSTGSSYTTVVTPKNTRRDNFGQKSCWASANKGTVHVVRATYNLAYSALHRVRSVLRHILATTLHTYTHMLSFRAGSVLVRVWSYIYGSSIHACRGASCTFCGETTDAGSANPGEPRVPRQETAKLRARRGVRRKKPRATKGATSAICGFRFKAAQQHFSQTQNSIFGYCRG